MTAGAGGVTVERLRTLPLFASLDDRALERVAAVASEVEFPTGYVLIEPRQAGSGLFVLLTGHVEVDLRVGAVELGPGDVVGELSLLVDDGPRSARVCAQTPVRCLAISRGDFEELLDAEPRIAVALARQLATRLHRLVAP